MFQSYFIDPDAVDPEDVPHAEVFLPVQRPAHDPRKHILLCDAHAELDRICRDKEGFTDCVKLAQLRKALERALIADVVRGGFLSIVGFAECDGVELAEMGFSHARVGPYIADWRQGPHRQGAYVLDARQFASFLREDPLSSGLENIVVHPNAPIAVRFFAGEGLGLIESMMPCPPKKLAHALETLFWRRHPNAHLNKKVFAMMAAAIVSEASITI